MRHEDEKNNCKKSIHALILAYLTEWFYIRGLFKKNENQATYADHRCKRVRFYRKGTEEI